MDAISHPTGSWTFGIKSTYVELMDQYGDKVKYPACAAAILTALERWHSWKMDAWLNALETRWSESAAGGYFDNRTRFWVFMSQRQWRKELMSLFSVKVIAQSLFELEQIGLIASRNNPHKKRDRTYQYLFRADRVQAALDKMSGVTRSGGAYDGLRSSINALKSGMQSAKTQNAKRQMAECNTPNGRMYHNNPNHKDKSQKSSQGEIPAGIHKFIHKFSGNCQPDKLNEQIERLGESRVIAVIERCHGKGRTWRYVLTALKNEPTPIIAPRETKLPTLPQRKPTRSEVPADAPVQAKPQKPVSSKPDDEFSGYINNGRRCYQNVPMFLRLLDALKPVAKRGEIWLVGIPATMKEIASRYERDLRGLFFRQVEFVEVPA